VQFDQSLVQPFGTRGAVVGGVGWVTGGVNAGLVLGGPGSRLPNAIANTTKPSSKSSAIIDPTVEVPG
jgi:hypothetical protein